MGIKKKRLAALLVIVLILLLIAAAIWIAFRLSGDAAPGRDGLIEEELSIDEGAAPFHLNPVQIGGGGAEVGIKMPGYRPGAMPSGSETLKIALLNPEGNPCYFVFDITLKDTGESLYTSKLVPPGMAVTEQTLSRSLKTGVYPLSIRVSTFSLADQTPMNGANIETTLHVYEETEVNQ